jgi:glucose-1-phosphate cytidylyltransferase
MKVVIFCGGRGIRLSEETDLQPKPLVKVGGKPILWHIMKIYAHYGFKEFVLCLGYKGTMIKEYFYHYEIANSDFTVNLHNKKITQHNKYEENDWQVTLVDTGESTLKGARLKKIERYIDGDEFMLTYGDGIADIDLNRLLAFHKKHKCVGTVTGVRPPSRFGELVSKNNRVVSFIEKPQVCAGLINGGFFVLNKKVFDYLTDDDDCDFEKGPLEQIANKGLLAVYEHPGNWSCMDTLRDKQYLDELYQSGKAFWQLWKK